MASNPKNLETTLDLLEPGDRAQIIAVKGKGAVRRRILDMGMTPGTPVEVVRKAPMGDPIDFKVKGYHLSLRKTEAEYIEVSRRGEA